MPAGQIVNVIPTYGYWGGPGWSGGVRSDPNTPLTPAQLVQSMARVRA